MAGALRNLIGEGYLPTPEVTIGFLGKIQIVPKEGFVFFYRVTSLL